MVALSPLSIKPRYTDFGYNIWLGLVWDSELVSRFNKPHLVDDLLQVPVSGQFVGSEQTRGCIFLEGISVLTAPLQVTIRWLYFVFTGVPVSIGVMSHVVRITSGQWFTPQWPVYIYFVRSLSSSAYGASPSRPKERPSSAPPKWRRKTDGSQPTSLVSATTGPPPASLCKCCNNSLVLDVCRKFSW